MLARTSRKKKAHSTLARENLEREDSSRSYGGKSASTDLHVRPRRFLPDKLLRCRSVAEKNGGDVRSSSFATFYFNAPFLAQGRSISVNPSGFRSGANRIIVFFIKFCWTLRFLRRGNSISMMDFCLGLTRRFLLQKRRRCGVARVAPGAASVTSLASDPEQLKSAREDIKELLRTKYCHPIMVVIRHIS